MAYTISDLTIIDVPSLISIYVSAFSDNPLYRVLWLDTHAASQSYGAYVGEEMFGDKKVRMRKAVVEDDGARGSGEMVAFAIWLLVEPEEDPGAGASAGAGTDTNPLISSAEAQTNFSLSKSEGLDDDERVAAEVEMKAKRVLARNSDNPSTDVAAMVEAFSKQVSLMKDREGLQSMRHIRKSPSSLLPVSLPTQPPIHTYAYPCWYIQCSTISSPTPRTRTAAPRVRCWRTGWSSQGHSHSHSQRAEYCCRCMSRP